MQTVSDDVGRIWDSERLSDDVADDLLSLSDQIDALLLPDANDTDDDYRTDDYRADYRIEETLEQCPFDVNELLDQLHGV